MAKETKTVRELLNDKFASLKKLFSGEEGNEGGGEAFTDVTLEDGTVLSYEGELGEGTVINIKTGEDTMVSPAATYTLTDGTVITVGDDGVVTEVVPGSTEGDDNDDTFTQEQVDALVQKATADAHTAAEKKFTAKIDKLTAGFNEVKDLFAKLPAEQPKKKKFSSETTGENFSAKQRQLIANRSKK